MSGFRTGVQFPSPPPKNRQKALVSADFFVYSTTLTVPHRIAQDEVSGIHLTKHEYKEIFFLNRK